MPATRKQPQRQARQTVQLYTTRNTGRGGRESGRGGGTKRGAEGTGGGTRRSAEGTGDGNRRGAEGSGNREMGGPRSRSNTHSSPNPAEDARQQPYPNLIARQNNPDRQHDCTPLGAHFTSLVGKYFERVTRRMRAEPDGLQDSGTLTVRAMCRLCCSIFDGARSIECRSDRRIHD
jgi:hypothetical protein